MALDLVINNLTVGYDRKPVAGEIDICIKKGEIVTLIGPNGSGKSTMLKTIAGQLAAITGSVSCNGVLVTQDSTEKAKILATAFTERQIDQMVTCREVVEMGRYPHTGFLGRLSEQDELLVDEAMRRMKVDDLKDKYFGRISDGQRQRVILARAFVQETPVILLDEPTSYLDIRYRLEFLEVLRQLVKEQGKTVLLSLHELDAAAEISDRILCLDGRGGARIGQPEEILLGGGLKEIYGIPDGMSETYIEELENYLERIIRGRGRKISGPEPGDGR